MGWAMARFGSWYRGAWWAVAAFLAVVGVAGSSLMLGASGAFLLGGLAAGLTALSGWRLRLPPGGRPLSPVVLSAASAVVVLALVGLVVELGPVGLWIGALVALAGFPALRYGRRAAGARPGSGDGGRAGRHARGANPRRVAEGLRAWRAAREDRRAQRRRRAAAGGGSVPAGPPVAPVAPVARPEDRRVILFDVPQLEQLPPESMPPLADLTSLSTERLCWAWRVSYVKVHAASCGTALVHLGELRRGYLDELERRDPVAFARWFPTARAASDPARFFCCPAQSSRPVQPPPASPPARSQRNDASRGSQRSGAAG